jgi:tetratricopeptide (TPR) repeat protein
MFVRVLTGSLVFLMLVCCSLLPAAYATGSTPTPDWQEKENASMKAAADVRLELMAEKTAPAVAPAVLAPNAQKQLGKALEALRANKLREARSHLDAAYRLAPSSADVNYIFGVYSSQANDLDQAKSYWTKALEINPKHLNALLSLADLLLRENKTDEALPLLKRATEAEPSSWRSHALLCHALLMRGSLDEAIEQAERALELGHGPATIIEPLLATALAGRGDTKRAISVLQGFLKEHPGDATANQQLQGLRTSRVAVAKKQEVVTANQTGRRQDKANVVPEIEVGYLHTSRLPVGSGLTATSANDIVVPDLILADSSMAIPSVGNGPAAKGANEIVVPDLISGVTSIPLPSNWLPPDVDERVPPVEPDAACALDDVLQKAGERIQEFVTNVDRFTATELLKHESINRWGLAAPAETRKFDYVVSVEEIRPGFLGVQEYRSRHGSGEDFPDGVATNGLPALVLIFHPYNTGSFEMSCEGLARWNGTLGWQVHFRQRSDKPNKIRSYRIGSNGPSYPVALRGRAWIAADSYQILRLETDLIAPLPEIRLATDRAIIEYGPVHFREGNVDMWLPQSAELYYDWRGRRSHRRHSFSNYLLFSVGDKQRISVPKTEDESASNQPLK